MQLPEMVLDGAVTGGHHLERLIQGLGDLAKRARPVEAGGSRNVVRTLNQLDRIEKRGLLQGLCGGHWEGPSLPGDGLGWTQVDVYVFWENVNSILRASTYIFVPNLRST